LYQISFTLFGRLKRVRIFLLTTPADNLIQNHTMNLQSQLDHYLTQWDIKQSTKRGYNPFALGIYLERAADLASDVAQGATISDAIDVHFCDRIAAMLHKKFS
jgi:hypothetical protein